MFDALTTALRRPKLDLLIVTSFAPGYSVYNMIEHLWAPLSRSLIGVKGNPIADGDDRPPAYMTNISTRERTQKEIEVFDREMRKVKQYWEEKTFDAWPIKSLRMMLSRNYILVIWKPNASVSSSISKLTIEKSIPHLKLLTKIRGRR